MCVETRTRDMIQSHEKMELCDIRDIFNSDTIKYLLMINHSLNRAKGGHSPLLMSGMGYYGHNFYVQVHI